MRRAEICLHGSGRLWIMSRSFDYSILWTEYETLQEEFTQLASALSVQCILYEDSWPMAEMPHDNVASCCLARSAELPAGKGFGEFS
jgi:hypothetical protein